MTRETALVLLKTMYAMYKTKGGEPLIDPVAREEYIKVFMSFDDDVVTQVYDEIFKKYKFCPGTAELWEDMRAATIQKKKAIEKTESIKCYVCEDMGAIIHKINGIDYALYCDQCEYGLSQAYDGRKIDPKKNNPSKYYMEPLSKYIDPEILKAENMFKKRGPVPCPQELKVKLKAFGIHIRGCTEE